MPTIVTHAAVPLCLGLGLGSRIIPPRLLLAGVAIAMLPDADVLAFKLGVAYGHVFGHRGFTHSLLFAFALPTLAMLFHRQLKARTATVWSFFAGLFVYGDGIHLTVAHKREWSYGFKPDNKTVPLPCYPESPYDHQRESSTSQTQPARARQRAQ